MVSEKVTLVNPQGLHMRPAGLFASSMGKYACDVTIVTADKEVNGKSPMALMAAGIPCGTEVEVKCGRRRRGRGARLRGRAHQERLGRVAQQGGIRSRVSVSGRPRSRAGRLRSC